MKIKFFVVACALILSACGTSEEKSAPAATPAPPGSEKDLIRKVISGHAAEVQSCYKTELRTTPDLEGKVVIAFVIAKDGSVDKSWIKSTTAKNSQLESCILDQVNTWTFAAPPEGKEKVDVSYPFVFKTQKD